MKKEIEKMLNSMSFVRWDRYTQDGNFYNIYGWIDRAKDSYKDFVLLQFDGKVWYWVSSSAEYDKQISKIIDGDVETSPCKRIEYDFDIKNVIKLKK